MANYFQEAFNEIEDIDIMGIKSKNTSEFFDSFHENATEQYNNITGLVERYVIDTKDALKIKINRLCKSKAQNGIDSFDYPTCTTKLKSAIEKALPKFLDDNARILLAVDDLLSVVAEESFEKRISYLQSDGLKNALIDAFLAKKKELNEAQKSRSEAAAIFEQTFSAKTTAIKNRVRIVNAYIDAEQNFKSHYENCVLKNGLHDEAFRFAKSLEIQSPLEHMLALFNEHFLSGKVPSNHHQIENLKECIISFCFEEDGYKKGTDSRHLYDELKKYELEYNDSSSIQYLENGSYGDISKLSPGTQANILLEYIVHTDATKPLLIDQPEDNVDNETIYGRIKTWFSELKRKRQVIVVTHDANIVVNADAENLVFATQTCSGSFAYENGALEYGDHIDKAATILDGGRIAVKRRLMKYSE